MSPVFSRKKLQVRDNMTNFHFRVYYSVKHNVSSIYLSFSSGENLTEISLNSNSVSVVLLKLEKSRNILKTCSLLILKMMMNVLLVKGVI